MVITINTETFEQSQALFDLCCISNLDTYDFVDEPETHREYGIVIVVTTLEHKFATRRIIDYVFDHFNIEESKEND